MAAMTERTATADATTVETPQSTAGMTAPFASRINKLMKPIMLMLLRLFSTVESTSHAWYTTTENADLESFEVIIGDGAERPTSGDEIYL